MTRRILLVTGISGSGKDFLLAKARRLDSRVGAEIPVIDMGSAIAANIAQEGRDEHRLERDRIKHLVTNDALRNIVQSVVAELVNYPAAIINGHVTYRQQGELVANPDIDALIGPAAYAVIVAAPKDIMMWRSSDLTRMRETETLAQIAQHQRFTVKTAEKMASLLSADFVQIDNSLRSAYQASLRLATMVERIWPKQ